MNIVAIIQARCGSTRFPNKIFAEINGKPLIWHVINRLKFSQKINRILLATTTSPSDDKLEKWAENNEVEIYRGQENDVLNRFYEGAKLTNADIIVRITADDPFKEPRLIDDAIGIMQSGNYDFVCNNNPPSFPEGVDVEVLTFDALSESEKESNSDFEREHVTQYIYHNLSKFKTFNLENNENLSYLRWTIDTTQDFELVCNIYDKLDKRDGSIFHMDEIIKYINENPEVGKMNSNVPRSELYKKI